MKRRRRVPDIDQWLESGLRAALDPLADAVAPSSRYAQLAGALRPVSRLRPVYFAASMLAGLLALTVVTASAATGTVNPLAWQRHFSRAVEACTSALPAAGHGVGECARDFVIADTPPPVTLGHGSRSDAPTEHAPASAGAPTTPGVVGSDGPGSPAAGSTGAASPTGTAPPAGTTGNPHTPANPHGNPHTPENPTGNPHPKASPPGHGGANPGQGHLK